MAIVVQSLPGGPFSAIFTANLNGKSIPTSGKTLVYQQTVTDRSGNQALPRRFAGVPYNGGVPASCVLARVRSALNAMKRSIGSVDNFWLDYEPQWLYGAEKVPDASGIPLMKVIAEYSPSRYVNWRFEDASPLTDSRLALIQAGIVAGKDVGIEVYRNQSTGFSGWVATLDKHLDMCDALGVLPSLVRAFFVPVIFSADGSTIAGTLTDVECNEMAVELSNRGFGSIYCWGDATTLTAANTWAAYYTNAICAALLDT